MAKEETKTKKEKTIKKVEKKVKKNKVQKENYFASISSELKKVKWPSKKEVLKYTMATLLFVLILVGFFLIMSLVMSGIKGAFN